jgi:hypothetical protein
MRDTYSSQIDELKRITGKQHNHIRLAHLSRFDTLAQ